MGDYLLSPAGKVCVMAKISYMVYTPSKGKQLKRKKICKK
jgi:hypothetical protein